jgi:hypothetical protein
MDVEFIECGSQNGNSGSILFCETIWAVRILLINEELRSRFALPKRSKYPPAEPEALL